MKLLALLFSSMMAFYYSGNDINETPQFSYLLGGWNRTNDKQGKQTYEEWRKVNDTTYLGHGYTLQGQDTVWQEWTEISPINGTWYFQARMKDDSVSTDFVITSFTDTSFVCENPENEFPKIIRYRKEGNTLKAEIEAGDFKILFDFSGTP